MFFRNPYPPQQFSPAQDPWLSQQMQNINQGLADISREIGEVKQSVRNLVHEQDRQSSKLDEVKTETTRLDRDLTKLSATLESKEGNIHKDYSTLKKAVAATDEEVRRLRDEDLKRAVRWNGPIKIFGIISAVVPALGGLWYLLKITEAFG